MIFKTCKYCGKEFRTYAAADQTFCSRECYRKYAKGETVTKKCEYCGKPFQVKATWGSFKRFCSSQCQENSWHLKHYHNDNQYRLSDNMSGAIWQALKENKANRHWEDLVGYTLEELKQRLECQFEKGMSWDNYGRGGWEIDHKKPRSAFDFDRADDSDFKDCWSLANLQPLWREENRSKHTSYSI